MTNEEKQLLLIDICARLPYGVKGIRTYKPEETITLSEIIPRCKMNPNVGNGSFCELGFDETPDCCGITEFKPYLRPMSSMTEEEQKEFSVFIGKTETYVQQICLDADSMANPVIGGYKCVYWGLFDKCIDWLNSYHFDFRGLIPMGLALEASEGMYA